MITLEDTIFRNLIVNKEFSDRVLPYLKESYFQKNSEKLLFKIINAYYQKYDKIPSFDDISTIISSKKVNEKIFKEFNEKIDDLKKIEPSNNTQWLIDSAEDFCKDRALYNAVSEAVDIYDNKSTKDKGSLQTLFEDALGISFNKTLGHDYIQDAEKRYEYYHTEEDKYAFDLDLLNKITKNGFSKKTLNIFVASPGVGKTLIMCHLASSYIRKGLNVLYISFEMSEEKISERIDVDVLDVSFDDLRKIEKEDYLDKIAKVKSEGCGRFIIKEFATSTAHKGHIRAFMRELELKEKFVPDILFLDYINIILPMNNKYGNSYERMKNVCEEIRGLAVELNIPIISATQTNRSGVNNSDLDYTHIAESMGVAATADFIVGMSTNDDLKKSNQILFKQLKNRYNDINYYNKFLIGIDYGKMRLYNLENNDNNVNMNLSKSDENKEFINNNLEQDDIFSAFKC